MKFYLIVFASIFLVLALTTGGRALIAWMATAFKPITGILIFLLSAHYTVARHLITSRSIIYPSLARKTVHRTE